MPKRVDSNQAEIVEGLRAIGASVTDLHEVGKGCPDLLVGYAGRVYLLEVKSKAGRLTPDERAWARNWRGGHYAVVRTVDQAVDVVMAEE